MAAAILPAKVNQIGVVPTLSVARGKYDSERDKRLRHDGNKQYLVPAHSEAFKKFVEDPWVEAGTPITKPVANGEHIKFLIVGAGYGGILFAIKLIKAGFSVNDIVFVDSAGGFGGTWYWNRECTAPMSIGSTHTYA